MLRSLALVAPSRNDASAPEERSCRSDRTCGSVTSAGSHSGQPATTERITTARTSNKNANTCANEAKNRLGQKSQVAALKRITLPQERLSDPRTRPCQPLAAPPRGWPGTKADEQHPQGPFARDNQQDATNLIPELTRTKQERNKAKENTRNINRM